MTREYMLNELMHYGDIDYLEKLSDAELLKVWCGVFGEE